MAKSDKLATHADGLALGEASAGAGALGLLGAAAVFLVAIVFFVAESYFIAMLLISFAMLTYVAGAELGKLVRSSFTVFFSGRHLIKNATHVQDTVTALRKNLFMKRDEAGWIKSGPIEPGTKIKLPDNPLVREIQMVLRRKKGKEYAEYVAHQYYVDCRELYDHLHAHLDFVAQVMPLFGAILASAYMAAASRFDQRIKALEYDYDILLSALDVLVENGAEVEVEA